MSELPEKQVKRLRSLIQEAETNLAAAKELLIMPVFLIRHMPAIVIPFLPIGRHYLFVQIIKLYLIILLLMWMEM